MSLAFVLVLVFIATVVAVVLTVFLGGGTNLTTRSYVAELILAGSSAKTSLAEGIKEHGSWSATWMSGITIASTGMVASASVGPTGQIILHGRAPTSEAVITLTPTILADRKLAWTCAGTPVKYMPASCRGQ